VRIEIKMSDMHAEKYEKILEGHFEHSEEGLMICYTEGETTTKIMASQAGVILSKNGAVQCDVTFEKGVKKTMTYKTPEISTFMEAKTHVIYFTAESFFLNYELYQGSEHINTIELKISKLEGK